MPNRTETTVFSRIDITCISFGFINFFRNKHNLKPDYLFGGFVTYMN